MKSEHQIWREERDRVKARMAERARKQRYAAATRLPISSWALLCGVALMAGVMIARAL